MRWPAVMMAIPAVLCCPSVHADPVPIPVPIPVPEPPGFVSTLPAPPVGTAAGIGAAGVAVSAPQLAPAVAGLFMCPGRGASAAVLGSIGGGYCNFAFEQIALPGGIVGTMHVHCEWGSAGSILSLFNCWRVFPGQPDHPALNDPDIIPDGWGVPWALTGPTPDDQWPPPGLAPAQSFSIPTQPSGPPPGPCLLYTSPSPRD